MINKRILASAVLGLAMLVPSALVLADAPAISFNIPDTGNIATVGQKFTFKITTTGITAPITYTYSDTNPNSSLTNDAFAADGTFSWTPTDNELGVHTVNITASGSGGVLSAPMQIIVQYPPAKLTAGTLSPGDTVVAGNTVTFTITREGLAYPTYSIVDSMSPTTVATTNINPSTGVFSWTPSVAEVGTHMITISGKDYHGMSANTTVTIKVVATAAGLTPVVVPAPVVTPAPVVAPAPVTTSSFVFTLPLKLGSSGNEVTQLQKVLIAGGFMVGDASGYYGAVTQAAVSKYQSAHSLEATGTVGPGTRAALNGSAVAGASVNASVTVNSGSGLSADQKATRIQLLKALIASLQNELNYLQNN